MKDKKLLVSLDLDETLIYTEDNPYRVNFLERKSPDFFTEKNEPVFFRPSVKGFIKKLKNHDNIKVGIFTASQSHYANPILEELFGDLESLSHLLYQERVTLREAVVANPYGSGYQREQLKDLKKVLKATKHDVKRTVAVDDKMIYHRHRGNTLLVPAYMAQKEDDALYKVYQDIDFLLDKDNVRDYIKKYAVQRNIKPQRNQSFSI